MKVTIPLWKDWNWTGFYNMARFWRAIFPEAPVLLTGCPSLQGSTLCNFLKCTCKHFPWLWGQCVGNSVVCNDRSSALELPYKARIIKQCGIGAWRDWYTVDPWTTCVLGVLTLHAVENLHITYSWPSIYTVPSYPQFLPVHGSTFEDSNKTGA